MIPRALTKEFISELQTKFVSERVNLLAQNVCQKSDLMETCVSRQVIQQTNHVFSHKVKTEGKPMTNQKNSGRCWIYATLNIMRIPFMKQYNLEEFEFSQSYLFFWDKVERFYYLLNKFVETAKAGEPLEGRLVSWLLQDPLQDGGQWDMVVNLINRYGLLPKSCHPDTFTCEATFRLNGLLKSKLREYAKVLRDMVESKASEEALQAKMLEQMCTAYRMIGIALGIPPTTFTFEYYDKSKEYNSLGPLTPLEFYEKHVKPYYNVDDKVCLVNDPRPTSSFGKLYTVDCLGNMVGGRVTLYNNQPAELLMSLCVESIKQNEAVWFGCEVFKRVNSKLGILDLKIHDFESMFGTDVNLWCNKGDRMMYGDSLMGHAMVITAVSLDADGKAKKFRVENSWGEDRGLKGYFVMTADWFKEFVFEVVVDRKIVPPDVLAVYEQEPIMLPAWDPMGTLAY